MRYKNTLIVMALAFVFAACSDTTAGIDGHGPTVDAVEDTGPEDGSSDVDPDSGDVVDGAFDTGDSTHGDTSDGDGLTSDADDTGPEAYTCSCPTEGDECVILWEGELACIDPASRQSPCDNDEDCASGYACNVVTDLCECDPEQRGDECFVNCNQDACPRFHQCGPGGRCEPPQTCQSDIQCKTGEVCVTIDTPEEFRTNDDDWSFCTKGGSKAPDELCGSDVECASGTCRRDEWGDGAWQYRCARRCLSDDDCPVPSERCEPQDGVCYVPDSNDCKTDCGGGQVCEINYCLDACRNSGECPEGDCRVIPTLEDNLGSCTSNPSGQVLCKPGEVRVHREDPYCRIATAGCSDHEDCPPDYECVSNASTFGSQSYIPYLCARRVKDGPWPLDRP